jgi:hypothetical protein
MSDQGTVANAGTVDSFPGHSGSDPGHVHDGISAGMAAATVVVHYAKNKAWPAIRRFFGFDRED